MSNVSPGIITRSYKSGSIIYFEGDRSENIFVLKSGRVILTSIKLDTGEEIKEDVRQGEFFGVKSSLGKYPREETAQTIGDTMVLVMGLADFERLVLRNVNVVRKMLRVFSNQLRKIHRMVRSVLGETAVVKPDAELFRIGEYYNNAGSFKHAEYVFKKYIDCYPDGEFVSIVREKLQYASTGKKSSPAAPAAALQPASFSGAGLDDFDFDAPEESVRPAAADTSFDFDDGSSSGSASSPLSSEMDDFLSSDAGSGDLFGDEGGGMKFIKEMYDAAKKHQSLDDHDEALAVFKKIIDTGQIKNRDDQKMFEAAFLEAGKCLLKMKKTKEAFEYLGRLLKEFPASESIKEAVYHIGLIFESAGQRDKAVVYYNKALNMQPKDQISINALNKIKQLQGSGR